MEIKWNKEEVERLTKAFRNREIIRGIVRSVGLRKMPMKEGTHTVTKEIEVAVFEIPGGIRAYCPIHEFSKHEYKGLGGFVGTEQDFIIKNLHVEEQGIFASVKDADELQQEAFIDEIKLLESKDELKSTVYKGTVMGVNEAKGNVFVKVRGTETFMFPHDWDHDHDSFILNKVQRGMEIPVKVIHRVDENGIIRVSRKDAIENPWERVESFKNDRATVGVITGIDPVHGIFVRLDVGVELKGEKPKRIQQPDVGDRVSCRIKRIDVKKQRGQVVITGYPNGKKSKRDVGDFLYTNG